MTKISLQKYTNKRVRFKLCCKKENVFRQLSNNKKAPVYGIPTPSPMEIIIPEIENI